MAFATIQPSPGLPPPLRRRAHEIGPPGVAVRTSYPSLLRTAGFVDIGSRDCTAEYRTALSGWIGAIDRRAEAVRDAIGDAVYDERAQSRARTLVAVDGGLLGRFMYWAARPR
ncbi:MAG: hypothetical protein ACC660_06350 [Acidimicrobiales bacterium]